MKWIKCSEKMPKSGLRVLAFPIDNSVPAVDWVDDFGQWVTNGWKYHKGYTHWMPLPPPPTED